MGTYPVTARNSPAATFNFFHFHGEFGRFCQLMNPKYFRTPRPVRLFRSTPVSSFPIASCELARKSRWCELCSSPLVHDHRPEFSCVGVVAVVVVVSKVRHSKMTGDYVRCIHSVVSGGGFSQPTALAGMLSYRVPEQAPILGTANRRSLLFTVTTGNATYPDPNLSHCPRIQSPTLCGR